MRTETKLLIVAAVVALVYWPFAFYSRPYPAFGGESLLLVAIGALSIANYIHGRDDDDEEK